MKSTLQNQIISDNNCTENVRPSSAMESVQHFILYNTQLKRPLLHPQVGLWCSPDKAEAVDLLTACHEYVRAIGREDLVEHIQIRNITEINT